MKIIKSSFQQRPVSTAMNTEFRFSRKLIYILYDVSCYLYTLGISIDVTYEFKNSSKM